MNGHIGRKISLGLGVALLAILLSSCETLVTVRHMVPAETNLSDYRTIAVASTKAYRFPYGSPLPHWIPGMTAFQFNLMSGYEDNLADQVADKANDLLLDSLSSTGYFTILEPKTTDAYITIATSDANAYSMLADRGVKAILTSSISYMDCEEYVDTEDITKWVSEKDATGTVTSSYNKVVGRRYTLMQKARVTFSYTLTDIATKNILVSRSFTSDEVRKTPLGVREFSTVKSVPDVYDRIYTHGTAPAFLSLFEQMLSSFQPTIKKQLAPTVAYTQVALMSNKPKMDAAKQAYKLAESGSYGQAYRLFFDIWEQTGHVPSGYNAAVLLEATGELDEAIDLMQEVCMISMDPECGRSLARMQQALSDSHEAERQLEGSANDDHQLTMKQELVME